MSDCVFCKIISGEFSCYKVYEDSKVIAFLSIDPVTYGHTLVVPKEHVLDYSDIPLDTLNDINKAGKIVFSMIDKNLKPQGIKLVQNNGSLQEVKHFHLHIIPVFDKDMEDIKDFDNILKNILK